MLEAYSLNVTVPANTSIPFNNTSIRKGCTAELNGVSTIELNKCGVYMIACDTSAAAATTIQLFKDGIAQPQAQSTGTSPSFVTLVQVDKNNSCCPCSSPTTLEVYNADETAGTYNSVNVVVTKII